MLIETDDYMTFGEAARLIGKHDDTTRKAARRLGILETFFGVNVIRRDRFEDLKAEACANKSAERWEKDYFACADAVRKGVERRQARRATQGPTPAEKKRDRFLRTRKSRTEKMA